MKKSTLKKFIIHTRPIAYAYGTFWNYYLWCTPASKTSFNAHEIIDGLWLGDMEAAHNVPELEKRGITHVVTVIIGASPAYPKKFQYKTVPVMDVAEEPLTPYFDDIVEFIHEAINSGGRVFIHCRRGKSRSASFVLAYLMSKHSHNLEDALQYVKQRRSIVQPNPGFMQQLRDFESNLTSQQPSEDNNATAEDLVNLL